MTFSSRRRTRRAGFTMIEMLISMVVLSLVMGAAVSVLRSQSKNFRKGGASMDLNQNARFTMSATERVLRTLGSGVPTSQPMLVYADANTIVFNANFASDVQDGEAVYINPDLPATSVSSISTATLVTIPGTVITYPPMNYLLTGTTPSRAETIMLYFRSDSSTADPNDYVLMQRVNNTTAEMISKNVRAYSGRPFFQYWFDSTTVGGSTFSRQVATARLPVRHTAAMHGSTADTGASALADSVKMVRINFVVTNGILSADSASRQFSTAIQISNNGLVNLKTCGSAPLNANSFLGTSPATGAVQLTWLPSADESSGEADVQGYNLYYRLASALSWDTYATQAAGLPADTVYRTGLMADSTYVFGIAAQDCSPQESSSLSTVTIHVQP